MRFIDIDGKRYLWRDLLKLRREQRKEAPRQPTPFELKDDTRPAGERNGVIYIGKEVNRLEEQSYLGIGPC